MKILSGLFLFFCFISLNVEAHVASSFMPKDSVDFQQIEGKQFILHKVEKGEGLFGIARTYKISVAELKKLNPKAANGLKIGQLIKVPYLGGPQTRLSDKKEETREGYVVKSGETLFSIAKKHGISTQKIIETNKLSGNSLRVGQHLELPGFSSQKEKEIQNVALDESDSKKMPQYHEIKSGETIYALARQYEIGLSDIKSWNSMADGRLEIGQRIIVGFANGVETESLEVGSAEERVQEKKLAVVDTIILNSLPLSEGKRVDKQSGKVTEVGRAELIQASGNANKYLAMHRTVAVGTIIHVTNQTNKLSVFIRVIGKLPNTGANEKVLIKISQKAFDRLGGVDKNFPVELTYLLEEETENQ